MNNPSIYQLAKFKNLMKLYGEYEKVGNVSVFKTKTKTIYLPLSAIPKYL